jgi:hypothetical protein
MATTVQQLAGARVAQWEGFNIGLWQNELNVRDSQDLRRPVFIALLSSRDQ